jgi:DNA-directed RNA polymerase subunit RPC12/RpoP
MQNQNIQIRLDQTEELKCKCGSAVFIQVNFIRIVPALLSPTLKPEMMPIPAFQCVNCQRMAEIPQKKEKVLQ